MIFDLLTLFPEVCRAYCQTSILGRAQKAGHLTVRFCDIRRFAADKHRTVDDAPYGGGDGMVMMAPPIVAALESLPAEPRPWRVLCSPAGRPFDQALARSLAQRPRLVLICGRYEGVDQRVSDLGVDQAISLGDFVLSGGELAALAIVEAVSRMLPGVLGGAASARQDSFMDGLLEHPHYTRPPEFRGLAVPPVLLSGDHGAIARWRRRQSLLITARLRPELLARAALSEEDRRILAEAGEES